MIFVLAIYAVFVWLIFFRLKILPWKLLTKIAVSLVGLAILLVFMALLNKTAALAERLVRVIHNAGFSIAAHGGSGSLFAGCQLQCALSKTLP